MRLALLSPLPPEQTGIADYAANCRRALNGAGIDVLTPLLGQRPLTSLAEARRWVAERDWSKVDVVHAELGGGRHSEFFALCALARLPKPPALSATVHDPERLVWRPVSRIYRALERSRLLPGFVLKVLAVLCDPHTLWAERRLARKLDGLVALTNTGADRLAKRMRIPRAKVVAIPHGTLEIAAKPLPPLPPEGPIRLLYFGFIYSGKGIEDLVDALGRVRDQVREQARGQNPEQPDRADRTDRADQFRLTIAGGTSPDIAFGAQTSYLDSLRARVKARGLDDTVEWDLDIDARDIPPLIQRHHVMVLPYRESRKLSLLGQMRGTSGALAWAVACGHGTITSNARAFAEEIRTGNGQAYPQGDVAALAKVLADLVAEPERARQWADRAAELARQRQWPVTGEVFRSYFEVLMQRRGIPLRARRPVTQAPTTRAPLPPAPKEPA